MTNIPKYHKEHTVFRGSYQLALPLNLEGLVPNDESVRLLSHILEELDYRSLYQAYSLIVVVRRRAHGTPTATDLDISVKRRIVKRDKD